MDDTVLTVTVEGIVVFIATFCAPQTFAAKTDPLSPPFSSPSGEPTTSPVMVRIHACGTRLAYYTVEAVTRGTRHSPSEYEWNLDESRDEALTLYHYWDADLLEGMGFDRLVASVQAVYKRCGLKGSRLASSLSGWHYQASGSAGLKESHSSLVKEINSAVSWSEACSTVQIKSTF